MPWRQRRTGLLQMASSVIVFVHDCRVIDNVKQQVAAANSKALETLEGARSGTVEGVEEEPGVKEQVEDGLAMDTGSN